MANMKKLLQAAAGASSGAAASTNVEDVFSTYLYEGNGSSQVIANGVDLGGPADNVELHLQGDDNTTSADASTRSRTLTKTGTITAGTTTKKFTSSLDFNNDAYFVADAPLVNDTAPFCVETWIRWDDTQTVSNMSMICSQYASSAAGRMLFGAQSGNLVLRVNGSTVYLTTPVVNGTWYHIAWTWDGITHRLFKDGTLVDSSTTVPSLYLGTNTGIGGQATLSSYTLDGRIEDFRITQGKARYTEDFTVPSANFDVDTTSDGGGLVWIKNRDQADNHRLHDTVRGNPQNTLISNQTLAAFDQANSVTGFNSNGFNIGSYSQVNTSGEDFASWTFRKAPKFFDVVTYTGNGTTNRQISHNLGSAPGCIIVKRTNGLKDWAVYHRGKDNTHYGTLNTNEAFYDNATWWQDTDPTSTDFTVGNSAFVNANGDTYVAYLFAHNDGDGDFGPTGDQDIIKCGSYDATNGTALDVDLGFEPAWVMVKRYDSTGYWWIQDNMRGWGAANSGDSQKYLQANDTAAEKTKSTDGLILTSTGFTIPATSGDFNSNGDYIYIAIRRGPMAVPESADDVFNLYQASGTQDGVITSNFAVDMQLDAQTTSTHNTGARTRLQGNNILLTNLTNAESTDSNMAWDNAGGQVSVQNYPNNAIFWQWRRAPNFFDVVAYTGNGTAGRTVSHNLGVAPEMIWVKERGNTNHWAVYHKGLNGGVDPEDHYVRLNLNNAQANSASYWNDTAPTDSVFTVAGATVVNRSAGTYIAYLFASLDGVSKVGSYTGNGTTQNIDCGFSNGARFVLIKRTDASEEWHIFDTERGINAGNDPSLRLNKDNAEFTSAAINPYSAGFQVEQSATCNNNVNGGTYIFYAIA